MLETAGTKLQRARQLRHLSIEDASRATKIRPQQVADLEADDYSNFANLAYAKSFLVAYGKYLHVDTRPYMEAFADANTFGMDDYQYLSDKPLGVYRVTRRATRQSRKTQRQRIMLTVTAAGLLAIGLFCRLLYISYERLGDLDKIAARHEAREHPGSADGKLASAEGGGSTAEDGDADAVPAHAIELPALVASSIPVEAMPGPSVPLPGDGSAVRALLAAPPAQKPPVFDEAIPVEHRPAMAEPTPQKVVNNGPSLPVN